MTDLVKQSEEACASALQKLGFVSKRDVFLQAGPTKTVNGWLGLNLARWDLPAVLHVNPVVGVRHVPLERALAKLAGWPPPAPSVSRPLGYLTPRNTYVTWDFHAGSDLAKTAEDLADSVAAHGQPFIDKWSDWRTFCAELADSGLLLDAERFIVLPVAAALDGRRDEADRLIEQELARVGGAEDAYSQAYRQFAGKFAEMDFTGGRAR